MFNNLFRLYSNTKSNRTPLEDFNTECFAGVLQFHPEILNSFISFLKLPKGTYSVTTQAKYTLPDDPNCIVDMVLESDSTICFIENKVNSKEGWEQLERYAKVLDGFEKETYLKYCTKNVDVKTEKRHHFTQFRWYQIGIWLKNEHSNNAMAMSYLEFLKQQHMAMDTSISTNTVITLKHFINTYEAMDFHVQSVLPEFKKLFPNSKIEKQEKIPKLREFGRLARFIRHPLQDKSHHAEILYSIHFEDVKLQTQIWVHKDHKQAKEILESAKTSGLFDVCEMDEFGVGLRNTKKLFHFIDNENSEEEIKKWFIESFEKIRKFVDDNSNLKWDL